MSLNTFVSVLKYLKFNNDKYVRILWWEPLLHPEIKKYILLAKKGGFNSVIFSNLTISPLILRSLISSSSRFSVNMNVNHPNNYSPSEKKNIFDNLAQCKNNNILTILSYNIINFSENCDFVFKLASKYNISNITLKITNSSIWGPLIIDNTSIKLWQYIFQVIKKYHKHYSLHISCWLEQSIFSTEEINFIKKETRMSLNYWCSWNSWKFDILPSWRIIRCFPLERKFHNSTITVENLTNNNITYENLIRKIINKNFRETVWGCLGNKSINK